MPPNLKSITLVDGGLYLAAAASALAVALAF